MPPALAAARFAARTRHPGHLDAARAVEEVAEEFTQLARLGPLGCGPVARVATDSEVALDELAEFVRRHR